VEPWTPSGDPTIHTHVSLCPYVPMIRNCTLLRWVHATGYYRQDYTQYCRSLGLIFCSAAVLLSGTLFFRPACLGASTMPCRSPMIKHCRTPTRQSFVHQEGDQGMTGCSSCISHVEVCSRSEHSVRLARNYGPSRVLSTYPKFEEGA
jgi:hypothetical protein